METEVRRPYLTYDLVVEVDRGQLYLYSDQALTRTETERDDEAAFIGSLADARRTSRFVGAAGGLVVVMTPGIRNALTPVRVEVWAAEPDLDTEDWQHEVDIGLHVPDGRLVLEGSGGCTPVTVDVHPAGSYRLRVSGSGFPTRCADHYRVRMWPASGGSDPILRRCWPGWLDHHERL